MRARQQFARNVGPVWDASTGLRLRTFHPPQTRPGFDLEVGGRKVRLGERTIIMGVLNVTPDSFSDGGLFLKPDQAIQHALEMVRQGADWIDVGGESTRPGSRPLPAAEELRRVLPVIRGLRRELPSVPVSIDTTKSEVAEQALGAGASLLNDVSGLRFDPVLGELARRFGVPLILMHLRGRPQTMQERPFARDIWRALRAGLERSIRRARALGVRRSQLILDPGLGFGKSRRQNFEILAGLGRLAGFRLPVMVGTSRKSFVQAAARGEGLEVAGRARRKSSFWPLAAAGGGQRARALELADAAAVAIAILAGAHIVRVHDVAGVLPAVRVADVIREANRRS